MTDETVQVYSGSPITPEELLVLAEFAAPSHFVSDEHLRDAAANIAEWTEDRLAHVIDGALRLAARRDVRPSVIELLRAAAALRTRPAAARTPRRSPALVRARQSREPAAVEHERLAGHVAGVVAQQERDARPDVELGVAGPAERAHGIELGLIDGAGSHRFLQARSDIANGHTVLTRMPWRPHSSAAVRLKRRTAAFAAEYGRAFGQPLDAGAGAEVDDAPATITDVRVDGLHRDETAHHVDVELARRATPPTAPRGAPARRGSRRGSPGRRACPNSASAVATNASTCVALDDVDRACRVAREPRVSPPAPLPRAPASLRSATSTSAPASAAASTQPRPMPCAPPMTRTLLSFEPAHVSG